jgi:hypothetical protein
MHRDSQPDWWSINPQLIADPKLENESRTAKRLPAQQLFRSEHRSLCLLDDDQMCGSLPMASDLRFGLDRDLERSMRGAWSLDSWF